MAAAGTQPSRLAHGVRAELGPELSAHPPATPPRPPRRVHLGGLSPEHELACEWRVCTSRPREARPSSPLAAARWLSQALPAQRPAEGERRCEVVCGEDVLGRGAVLSVLGPRQRRASRGSLEESGT